MSASPTARYYIEMALREKLSRECPHYNKQITERVVVASMNGLGVTKGVLYRAIDLARGDALNNTPINPMPKSDVSLLAE